jgi:hypothetical protein
MKHCNKNKDCYNYTDIVNVRLCPKVSTEFTKLDESGVRYPTLSQSGTIIPFYTSEAQ